MLIDCDAAAFVVTWDSSRTRPDWISPNGEMLDVLSHRYKFGLFVLRCRTLGDQASTRADPAAAGCLDATGWDAPRRHHGHRPNSGGPRWSGSGTEPLPG